MDWLPFEAWAGRRASQHRQVEWWGAFSLVLTAAFANGAASRDFMYNTHQLLFTKPIQKLAYVMGRFWGAALVAVVPMLGVSLGILAAGVNPYVEPEKLGEVYWSAHAWGALIFAVPNAIIAASLIFAVAVYTRSTITAFIGAIVLLVGSSIASSLVSNMDNRFLAAMVDPFGSTAIEDLTRYWTVSDRNTKVVTLTGMILANRAIWLGISLGVLALAYWRFSFSEKSKKGKEVKISEAPVAQAVLPSVGFNFSWSARLSQLVSQIRVDFFETIKSQIFVVLLLITWINMVVAVVFNATEGFGLSSLPVTYNIVDLIRGSMYAFLIGIIAFYTGVLVWKERDAKLDEVYDALPQSTWTMFVGKLIAMQLIVTIVLATGILVGVLVQAFNGYTRFQIGLYLD